MDLDSQDKVCDPVGTSASLGRRYPVPLLPSSVSEFGVLLLLISQCQLLELSKRFLIKISNSHGQAT